MIFGMSVAVVSANYFSVVEWRLSRSPYFYICKGSHFVSTLYVALAITLSLFSVCHFVVFIEKEDKTFSLVFVLAFFFSLNGLLHLGV